MRSSAGEKNGRPQHPLFQPQLRSSALTAHKCVPRGSASLATLEPMKGDDLHNDIVVIDGLPVTIVLATPSRMTIHQILLHTLLLSVL